MSFIRIIIKNHFHVNGFALSLALKVRFFGTRKWPIEAIVSPNLDRLNLFVMFLRSLTGLKDFLVIFRAMTAQPWFLIGGLEAKKSFHCLIHVVEGISL